MPTYVSLIRWTDQGIRAAKDTMSRYEQARAQVERMGGRLTSTYWTQGSYDIVVISEFPDEETAMAFLLALGSQGNLRTETLRAFSAEEMQRVFQKMS